MSINLENVRIINGVKAQTLQLSPAPGCGGPLSPGDEEVISGSCDGVIWRRKDGDEAYIWEDPADLSSPVFGYFSEVTPERVVLSVGGVPGKPERVLVARRNNVPADAADMKVASFIGPDLSVQQLEYGNAGYGDSYDALTYRFMGSKAVTQTKLKDTAGSKTDYSVAIVDSKEKLANELSFSIEASANILGADVSGSASLYSKVDMEATSVSMVCKLVIRVGTKEMSKDGLTLGPGLDQLMAADPKGFYQQFGTHFISGASWGGELTVVFTKDYQSIEQKFAAAAAAKVHYGSIKVESEFKNAIESFSEHGEARMVFDQSGWIGLLPSMSTAEIIKYVEKFPIDLKGSDSKAIFRVILTPYTAVASPEAGKAFRAIVEPIFKITSGYVQALGDYDNILTQVLYAREVAIGNPELLRKWELDIKNNIRALEQVWMNHSGELTLPPVESLYQSGQVKPPADFGKLIEKVLKGGTPVESGSSVYLTFMTGQGFSKYQESYLPRVATWEWCPSIGMESESVMKLTKVGNPGVALQSGDVLTVETTEALPDKAHRYLSAFTDHYLYYYAFNNQWANNQYWRIEKDGGGYINYGDQVRFINVAWNQQMSGEGTGLTTVPNETKLHWVISKA